MIRMLVQKWFLDNISIYMTGKIVLFWFFFQTQPEVKKKKGKSYDYATKLNYLFRDARFFLVKSSVSENVDLSKVRGVWSTPPANEGRFNKAFRESRNVIMIYSVKESGRFCGFARLGTTHLLRKHFKGGRGSKWQFLLICKGRVILKCHRFDQNSNKNIVRISCLNFFVASWELPGSFLGLPWDLLSR